MGLFSFLFGDGWYSNEPDDDPGYISRRHSEAHARSLDGGHTWRDTPELPATRDFDPWHHDPDSRDGGWWN